MASQAKLNILITADDKASDSVGGLSKHLDNLSKLGGVVAAGIGAAFTAIGAGLAFAVGEAIESETVMAQLDAVLKSTGGTAGVTADMATGLADSLSQVTRFGDEAILSGENMLLTFTNIGKDVFPQATEIMLDMSQALGQDLQGSAVQLGKALNDPIAGISALSRVGVTFTEDQKAMIEEMVTAGDVMGAQTVILEELKKEFGGSAKAAGETFAGKVDILKNKLGNMAESVGNAVLPKLSELATMLSDKLSDPRVQAAIDDIAMAIGDFAGNVASALPVIISNLGNFFSWLVDHKEIIVGVLVGLGAAFASWVYTTMIPGAVALITATWPIVAPFLAIAAVAALLYKAWESNFLGIQDVLVAFWDGTLKPIFDQLVSWFKENIPAAIQTLSSYWNTVLLPAIRLVWNFIQNNIFPLFQALGSWLATNIPAAIRVLSGFWQSVLLPAIRGVWSFIQGSVIPLFDALGNLIRTVLGTAITALAGLWQNVLYPAMQKVWSGIQNTLIPIFTRLKDFISTSVMPILSALGDFVGDAMVSAFDGLKQAIQWVVGQLKSLADKAAGLKDKFPDWLIPGSPTPFEIGLRGINRELEAMAKKALPEVGVGFRGISSAGSGVASQVGGSVNNYYLTANYKYQDEASLSQDIRTLQMLGRFA